MDDDEVANSNVLIVDDTPANLTLLTNMLSTRGCRVRPVPSGKLALRVIENEAPDIILLDITMPEMNGYEVARKLKADQRFSDIPIIFISALSETMDKVEAFTSGGVDYVTKPFQFEEAEARVRTHLKLRRYQIYLEELVQEKVQEIWDLQLATIFALSKLSESRDKDTGRHLDRVQVFCRILAESLSRVSPYKTEINAEFIRNIINASPLHDIGKVAIPDDILLKPGKLNREEFERMKAHTTIGAQTLGDVKALYPKNTFINMGILIARSHHERWDGNGYPDGLAGEKIPLPARIMTIADVYDAIRSKRCYKEPMTREQSRQIILNESSGQFDPGMLKVFADVETEMDQAGCEIGFG